MMCLKAGDNFPCEESSKTELKAHDRLAYSQLTTKEIDKRLFQPASRTLCAFLNSNLECNLYLGVRDDGIVMGHPLLQDQKNHFNQNLNKLFKKEFSPPVDDYRYSVSFIRVQKPGTPEVAPREDVQLKQDHTLLSHPNSCWCEVEMQRRKNSDTSTPHYVIRIRIKPWDTSLDSHSYKIWPYYTNEEKKCFARYTGSNQEITHTDVIRHTFNDMRSLLKPRS